MAEQRLITCYRCRRPTPFDDIKYILRGEYKVALCDRCREQSEAQQKSAPARKASSRHEVTPQSKRIPYMCSRCNYKFRFDAQGQAPLRCPYCGKPDKLTLMPD